MPWNFFITPANYWNLKLSSNWNSTELVNSNSTGEFVPNWMQNFWDNFLSIFCTGVVFLMSILMHFRPKSWTKEAMISVSLSLTSVLFVGTGKVPLLA